MSDLTLPANPPIKLKTKELHAPLANVARTVSSICSASDACATRLDEIEEQIEETSGIEGVRVLRFRLEECLQALREQARHQREEMSQLFTQLQQQMEAEQGAAGEDAEVAPDIDKVSGLEVRDAAERAIAAAKERGGLSYVALFAVDRLHLLNAQFGYATGDRILRVFCQHLKSFLLPEDQLFRWTGPAFVAVIERSDDPADVEAEIQRIAGFKLEPAVQIGNRSVLLPVVSASLLMPLAGVGALADLSSRMDAFTGQQARH